jgi:hypothetical protein
MGISFIEDLPVTTFDHAGARTTYTSGPDTVVTRCSRALLRRYLETTIRQLNEYEAAERGAQRVVGLRRAH